MGEKENVLIKELANELLCWSEGEQIPTMPVLAKKYSAGFGTIDKALNSLKSKGVIELQSRGQMGTYLLKKNFLKLYELTDNGPFVGHLPLPNAIEYEGLATGLTAVFSEAGVPFVLNFKNGAHSRLESLLNKRCDFIVVSENSAEKMLSNGTTAILAKLSEKTFYSNLYIICSKNAGDRTSWKIGVDNSSYDNMLFSEREFPDNKKVNIPYYNFPYAISAGKIDAAIIHSRTFITIEIVGKLEFQPLEYPGIINNVSRAALVALKENHLVFELFREIIQMEKIEQIEKMVVDRKIVPSF